MPSIITSKQNGQCSLDKRECRTNLILLFLPGTYLEIIVPAAIGGIVLLFFVCLCLILSKKRRAMQREERQQHEIHIEHPYHEGRVNGGLEMNGVQVR